MSRSVQTLAPRGVLRRFGDGATLRDGNGSYCLHDLFINPNTLERNAAVCGKNAMMPKVRKKSLLPRKITRSLKFR
jgi:hypothetical protein